jgi:hypothetical protein
VIHDESTGLNEPTVVIEGETLTFAEAMTLRVALSSFRLSMNAVTSAHALGEMAKHYDYHAQRVEALLILGANGRSRR